MPDVVCIIQARMNSKRLPGKVMMDMAGKPMIEWVIQRVKRSVFIDMVILAVGDKEENRVMEPIAKRNEIKFFMGSEEDVLDRYYQAIKRHAPKAKYVVRITGDCPLIDPKIIDDVIFKMLKRGKR